MAEETEIKDAKVQKKTAPNMKVVTTGGNTIDSLYAQNPGERFMYVAMGVSKESLAEEGLEVVERNGAPMTHRGRTICRCVGKTQATKMAAEYREAQSAISTVRDIKTSDKQSKEAKPQIVGPHEAEDDRSE